jgi:hypothetical protein
MAQACAASQVAVAPAGTLHAVQLAALPQPYVGSLMETHTPPQDLYPALQLPTAHEPPEHVAVPLGIEQGAQPAPPQPLAGSVADAQAAPQTFSPAGHEPMAHVPNALQVAVAPAGTMQAPHAVGSLQPWLGSVVDTHAPPQAL